MNLTKLKDKFRPSKWRIYSARVGALALILLSDIKFSVIGILLIIIGVLIRLWASGHLRKRRKLTISGPYKYVRNPLYLGSVFIGLGFWGMSNQFFLFMIFFFVFTVMYAKTVEREEKELLQVFGKPYEKYLKDVPRFIPSLKNFRSKDEEKFSWANSIKNKEYMVALGVIGMLFIMTFMHAVVYPFIFEGGNLSELLKNYIWRI